MSLSHISTIVPQIVTAAAHSRPQFLRDLTAHFAELESLENPDAIVQLNELRMTEEGTLAIPNLGSFVFMEWALTQFAKLLGIAWDRWFDTSSASERADEINRRLSRRSQQVRLRTSRVARASNGKTGVLRAVVSPTFTPIPDSKLADMLTACLRDGDAELPISRLTMTDRTVSFLITVGRPFGTDVSDRTVGDVTGGVLVRNSGVGYASLVVSLQLTRLVCLNGMTCPVDDPLALHQAHRSFDEKRLLERLTEGLANLPGRLSSGVRRLAQARQRVISDPVAEFIQLLRVAHLPKRLLLDLQTAYAAEPEQTAFGISQAVTRASQKMPPEERFELDRAAGTYLRQTVSAN
jgi:hypothetical protein